MDAHGYNLRSRGQIISNSTTALSASRHFSHPPPPDFTGTQTATSADAPTGGGAAGATGDRIPANPGSGTKRLAGGEKRIVHLPG